MVKTILRNSNYKDLIYEMKDKNIEVDAIITDPPYNVSRKHQLGFSNMGRSGMNYGEWDYNFNNTEWLYDCVSVIKKGGSIIIFNDWKNLSYLVETLQKTGFIIKDLLRWEKKNPMPRNVNSRYVTDTEYALWAVKGKGKWTFNKPESKSYLRPVFESGLVPGGKQRIHPTQKHLKVIEEIIKIHTNDGDVVFDPFVGSGTIPLASKNLNRHFIGSEIDTNYYDKAVVRIGDPISSKLSWE